MKKIFGWVDKIDYGYNTCRCFLVMNPRKKGSKPFEDNTLDARWLWRNGIQRGNQPFVLKQYYKGNKHITEVKALCHKDDFKVVNLCDIDPEFKKKFDKMMETFKDIKEV